LIKTSTSSRSRFVQLQSEVQGEDEEDEGVEDCMEVIDWSDDEQGTQFDGGDGGVA
jgi:hypothetical protein